MLDNATGGENNTPLVFLLSDANEDLMGTLNVGVQGRELDVDDFMI